MCISHRRSWYEGISRRKRGVKKRHSKMKGQQKKRGNYCPFHMEMVMKWDMGLGTMGPQAGWASPCKLLPVREPFSPHFYWLTSHLQANYKEASPSKLEAEQSASPHRLFPGCPWAARFTCLSRFTLGHWWRTLCLHLLTNAEECRWSSL